MTYGTSTNRRLATSPGGRPARGTRLGCDPAPPVAAIGAGSVRLHCGARTRSTCGRSAGRFARGGGGSPSPADGEGAQAASPRARLSASGPRKGGRQGLRTGVSADPLRFFVYLRDDLRNLHKSPRCDVAGRPSRPRRAAQLRPHLRCGDWCRFRASALRVGGAVDLRALVWQVWRLAGGGPSSPAGGKVAFWGASTGKIGHFSTFTGDAPFGMNTKPQVRCLHGFGVLPFPDKRLTKAT